MECRSLVQALPSAFGLTGSDLRDCHIKFVEKELGFNLVRMDVNSSLLANSICHGVEVMNLVSDYREMIVKACTLQTQQTPVILIAEDTKLILQKKLER